MSSNNMYRVGDFVFFEASATTPYQIRRIDELNKTPTGAVEAKVTCYYRRRDISSTLIQQAEKYYFQEIDIEEDDNTEEATAKTNNNITDVQRHQIKHRELFLSHQTECLPATHIRGKCSVTLYNDIEPLTAYVARDDAFYYRLIYDPSSKRLQENRGSMRIGSDYQSEIQPLLAKDDVDSRLTENLEQLVWNPLLCPPIADIDLFITLTKAVGLFARSCDPNNAHTLLLNAATNSCRDITLQFAYDTLFKANYDIRVASSLLVPDGQPCLCLDELESWTSSEAALFEEALEKYSKFFPDILTDFLPWKTPKSIVELYYFWKTTERYTRHRRNKLVSQEHKLKQVYIPNYSKPNSAVLYNRIDSNDRGCACCYIEISPQWYAWGPPHLLCRLCSGCWSYWKKYGGLKNPDKRDRLDAIRGVPISTKVPNTPVSGKESALDVLPKTSLIDHRSAPAHHHIPDASLTSIIHRCSQPGCVKEFRSRDNLAIHLSQVHNVGSTNSSENVKACQDIIVSVSTSAPFQVPVHNMCRIVNRSVGDVSGGGYGAAYQNGTQCLLTPPELRIARTLCPELLRPALLARRPTRPANSTAKLVKLATPQSQQIISTDNLLDQLREFAKRNMSDPKDHLKILNRKFILGSLNNFMEKLSTKKKSIAFSNLETDHSILKRKSSTDISLNGDTVLNPLNGTVGDIYNEMDYEPTEKRRSLESLCSTEATNVIASLTTNGNSNHNSIQLHSD